LFINFLFNVIDLFIYICFDFFVMRTDGVQEEGSKARQQGRKEGRKEGREEINK